MVIEIPGTDEWRICGASDGWQIQKRTKKRGEYFWNATNYFTSLEYAVGFAYEKMLRGKDAAVGMQNVPVECRKVKESLLKAARKALE